MTNQARNLVRHFKTVLKRAGLPPTTRFHDLRHSCATLLITQGVHPCVVMDILGHANIAITMNTYTHVLPEVSRAAAEHMIGMPITPSARKVSDELSHTPIQAVSHVDLGQSHSYRW
jgi:integrase